MLMWLLLLSEKIKYGQSMSREIKTVELRLAPEDLAFTDTDLKPVVEPAVFEVFTGSSLRNIGLTGNFEKTI